jgi:peptidoglycan/LPS O-acetylase OafA/YrhL
MRGRVVAIDGLRGVAILMVLAVHLVCVADGVATYRDHLLYRLCYAGWSGVSLFFVLSGFLITGILLDGKGDPHRKRTFFARRTLRVFPLYYAALALWFFVLPAIAPGWSGVDHWGAGRQSWAWLYAVNWGVAARGIASFGPMLHFWTLAIEEHFYLVWPFVIWASSRVWTIRICIGCIVVSAASRILLNAAGVHADRIVMLDTTHLDALALGGLIALAIRGPEGSMPFVRPARVMFVISGFTLATIFLGRGRFDHVDWVVQVAGMTPLVAFFGSAVILAPYASGWAGDVLRSKGLRFFGKYSYGIYVWHGLLIAHFDRWFPFRRYLYETGSFTFAILLHAVLSGAASVAVAWASYKFLESPFLRLKRRFDGRAQTGSSGP